MQETNRRDRIRMRELIVFIRSRQPVNLLMVVSNLVVFAVLSLLGDTEDAMFMAAHGAAVTPLITEGGEYYRLFTSMFLHFGAEHLLYNMLMLIFLGDTLEKMAGKLGYLLIYLLGGLAGNLLSVATERKAMTFAVSAGASGAIFAVLGALCFAVILNKGKLQDYSGRRLLLMAVLSVVQGMTAEGINNWAHIGGLAAGFILAIPFIRRLRMRELPE